MNETITILENDSCWHGNVTCELSTAIYAALAADPVELIDLQAAFGRYCRERSGSGWPRLIAIDDQQPPTANQVIDLTGRTVFWKDDIPPSSDMVALILNGDVTKQYVPYTIASHWHRQELCDGWNDIVGQRRDQVPQRCDHRQSLYEGLCDYLVAHYDESADDPIASLHKKWILHRDPASNGMSPRDIFAEQLDHITADLENQKALWTAVGERPPGVLQGSYSFRYAGFGLAEYSVHYDMVRYLLHNYQRRFRGKLEVNQESDRVRYLRSLQQEWLHCASSDYEGSSPRQVITYERMRMPMVMSTTDLEDCDCPLCRMMCDGDAPMFWMLDSSQMDDDPAFSIWNDWLWEIDESLEADLDPQEMSNKLARLPESVWTRGFFNPVPADTPLEERKQAMLFKLAACIGELYLDLESDLMRVQLGGPMQSQFDRLREALSDGLPLRVDDVTKRLIDVVVEIGDSCSKLQLKCQDLIEQIDEFQKYFGAVA